MLGYTSHYCLHHNFTAFSSIPMAFQRLIPLHLPAPLIVLPIRKESHSRMFRKSKFNISKKFPCYIQLSVCAIGCQIIGSCSPAFYVYALLPKWTHLIPVLSDAAQCARLQATGAELESGSLLSTAFYLFIILCFLGGEVRAWRNPAMYLSYHHDRARIALGTDYRNAARLYVLDSLFSR